MACIVVRICDLAWNMVPCYWSDGHAVLDDLNIGFRAFSQLVAYPVTQSGCESFSDNML